jgi:DNA-binding CsgD family transcriptional regulator
MRNVACAIIARFPMTTSAPEPVVLVDRERVLRSLHALVAEAHARDEAAVVRVTGPPGIGKTALLRAAIERYAPWRWTAAKAGQTAVAGAWLATLGLDPDILTAGVTLFECLVAALADSAAICIDDAQWLDERSLGLIQRLVRLRGATLTMLLADRRDVAPELPRHHSMPVAPLRAAAGTHLVRTLYPDATSAVANEINACGSGNPFALQVLSYAARDARARRAADTEPSAEAVIAMRLERFPLLVRDAVRYAALLDPPVDLGVVARATGTGAAALASAMADARDLVSVERDQISFSHALIADAIRVGTADVADRYATLLAAFGHEDTRPDALIAMLRCARGSGDNTAAATIALRLSRALSASGMLAMALNQLTLAMEYTGRPLTIEFAVEYAGVLQQLAREREAGEFLRGELQMSIERRDGARAATLLHAYAGVAVSLEREVEFEDLCGRVEATVAASPTKGNAAAMIASARLAVLASAGWLERFDVVAAAVTVHWNDQRYIALAAALRGDTRTSRHAFQRYQAGLSSRQLRLTASDRAMAAQLDLFAIGNSALASADDGPSKDRGGYATGTALRLLARLNDGRWEAASAIVDGLLVTTRDSDEPYALLDARLLFSGISKRAPNEPDHTLRAVRALIGAGRVRHAIAPACWLWLGNAATGIDVPNDIRAYVTDRLDASPMPYLAGGIPFAVAQLAPQLGVARCREALGRRFAFASRWHVAHDDLAYGILDEDHERLRRARDEFDALDAPVFAMLAGIALPIPRAVDSALAQRLFDREASSARIKLTPREQTVAELAATGARNRAIAIRLGITERTVEVHLGNAFRKLGVKSRAELAHALLGRGVRIQL